MAIENAKTFNVRIKNKYDSYENWASSGLVLEAGEIAIAYTTVNVDIGNGKIEQHPELLMKVGNGSDTFADLPWLSAKAADVASWAKAKDKPTYEAKEITGIADYIAEYVEDTMGITVDTNTVYRTVKVDDYNYKLQSKGAADADTAWADVADSAIVIPNDTAAIEALQGLVGSTAVATQISDAIADLDLANTYAAKSHKHEIADVNGLSDAIADAKKAGTDANAALETYKGTNDVAVKANTDAIAAIKDDENIDSFADVVAELAKKQDTGDYATKEEAQGYANAKDEAIAAAKKAGDDAMAEAEKKVASVAAGDASVTVGGTATAPTVAAKLSGDADNALTLAEDGLKVVIPAAAEYSIVKAEDSGDYAAVYNLTKDGTIVGASINIPKDMVVKSGSVVGDEIVLVLNDEAGTEIKIPVASLIEYVTSGSEAGDMVVIAVDETTHKVTATITDGTITAAKLTTELQTAIGKAHTHENADVLAGINADKVAAWDAAEQNAKDYADGLDEAMDARVKIIEEAKATYGDIVTHNASEFALATNLDNYYTKDQADAEFTNATEVDGQIQAKIDALDLANKYEEKGEAAKVQKALEDYIVSNDDAVALKVNRDELANVATSGYIEDLSIGAGTTLVFDCGTSAV